MNNIKPMNEKILKKRRKSRHPFLNDMNDPYFVQFSQIWNRKIDADFADKYLLKGKAPAFFNTVNVCFTFNEMGEILTGSIPSGEKLIIKYNRGGDSRGIEIVDSKNITKQFLRKFVKKQRVVEKANSRWNTHHTRMPKVYFAEEYKEEFANANELKIFMFNNDYLIEISPKKHGDLHKPVVLYMYKSDGTPIESPITLSKDTNCLESGFVEEVSSIKEHLFNLKEEVGGFCRIDLFVLDGEYWLNEVTLAPGAPSLHWYDKKTLSWANGCLKKLGIHPNINKLSEVDEEDMKWVINSFIESTNKND